MNLNVTNTSSPLLIYSSSVIQGARNLRFLITLVDFVISLEEWPIAACFFESKGEEEKDDENPIYVIRDHRAITRTVGPSK
jgi:hypothetical protein